MSEPGNIVLACSGCRTRLQVKAQLAGKRVRCPRCSTVLDVPRVHTFDAAPPVASPAPSPESPAPHAPASPASAATLPTRQWMRSVLKRSWWTPRKIIVAVIVGAVLLATVGVLFWRDRAETVTVSGVVMAIKIVEDGETVLVLNDFKGSESAVVIPREHVKRFPKAFSYLAQPLRVTGEIGDYEEGKAVFVTSPGQIRIVTRSGD